jgi:hypothetical protein
MGNRQKLSHHEELTRQPVTMKNQFTEKKLLRRATIREVQKGNTFFSPSTPKRLHKRNREK